MRSSSSQAFSAGSRKYVFSQLVPLCLPAESTHASCPHTDCPAMLTAIVSQLAAHCRLQITLGWHGQAYKRIVSTKM